MSKKAPKPPTPIDPSTIINAQMSANRVNQITPFGSQTYGTGPNGQSNLTTTLSPEMQSLMTHAMQAAQTPMQRMELPNGYGGLQSAITNRLMQRYSQPGQKSGMQPMSAPAQMGFNSSSNAAPQQPQGDFYQAMPPMTNAPSQQSNQSTLNQLAAQMGNMENNPAMAQPNQSMQTMLSPAAMLALRKQSINQSGG